MSIGVRRTQQGMRYDVRLRDTDGHAYKRTFSTKREAEAFQARELADRSRGLWVDPRRSSVKFSEWAEQWITGDLNKRPRTRYDDAGCIRLHLNPLFGPRPLGSITPLEVRRAVSAWAASAAPATVRRRYAVLRAIFTAAVEADVLGRSPCRGIRLPQSRPTSRPVLAAEDLAAVADAAGPYRPMVYVAGVLGLRWGECAALRVGRIDLQRGTLTVAESLSEVAGTVMFGPPKSDAGRRTLAMPAALTAMLTEHLTEHLTDRGVIGRDDALVFTAQDGGPLRASNFRQRVWIPATRQSALEGLRFHDLRHTAASTLVAAGIDVRTAQERLGHSDPRLTLGVYAHTTPAADRAAADRVGGVLMPTDLDLDDVAARTAERRADRSIGRDVP